MKDKENKYVIGIDGGGTKTVAALADLQGMILKIGKAGSASVWNIGIKAAVKNITEAIKKILSEKEIKISSVVVGLTLIQENPELSSKIQKEIFKDRRIHRILKGKIKIVSDQIVGFRAGTDKKDGIVLIAGTGCVVHGWKKGKEAIASGWGWLADEGSSFWIGQKVYQTILKYLDGRGPKNLLKKFVFQKFRIKEDVNLLNKLIYFEEPNKVLAPLSIICDKAAKKGDRIAQNIMREAGKELALSANTVIKKLNFQKIKFPVVLVGSMFNSKIILKTVKKEIKRFAPKAEFILPKDEPVVGAIKMALNNLNGNLKK